MRGFEREDVVSIGLAGNGGNLREPVARFQYRQNGFLPIAADVRRFQAPLDDTVKAVRCVAAPEQPLAGVDADQRAIDNQILLFR